MPGFGLSSVREEEMRIKLALRMAPLALFLAVACCGVSFAQGPSHGGEVNGGAFSSVGVGVQISTLGVGIEADTPLVHHFNLRGGFNMFRYSRPITNDGIQYQGSLRFQSVEAHLDYYFLGPLHVSPGILLYNGNSVSATAVVPGGQSFSLGGTSYQSSAADPVNGSGLIDFVRVSPTIMLGIGTLVPHNGRHFGYMAEIGAAYVGPANVVLSMAGSVCDPTGVNCRTIASDPAVQANIQAQQNKIQNDIYPYRFYPILSVGVGYRF
jgi:hypothetical protein